MIESGFITDLQANELERFQLFAAERKLVNCGRFSVIGSFIEGSFFERPHQFNFFGGDLRAPRVIGAAEVFLLHSTCVTQFRIS